MFSPSIFIVSRKLPNIKAIVLIVWFGRGLFIEHLVQHVGPLCQSIKAQQKKILVVTELRKDRNLPANGDPLKYPCTK